MAMYPNRGVDLIGQALMRALMQGGQGVASGLEQSRQNDIINQLLNERQQYNVPQQGWFNQQGQPPVLQPITQSTVQDDPFTYDKLNLLSQLGGPQLNALKMAYEAQQARQPKYGVIEGVPGELYETKTTPGGVSVRGLTKAPPRPLSESGFTLSPGQVRYGPDGRPIAEGPPPLPEDANYRFDTFDDPETGKRYRIAYDAKTNKEVSRELVGKTPPTAEMRNKVQARSLVQTSINAVKAYSDRVLTKVGPAQRVEAIKRGAEAVFGNDPEFRTYQDARMALAGNLAVAQQGSRPSDADIKAIWLPIVPDPYRDTRESAEMKWELIRQMSLPQELNKGAGDDLDAQIEALEKELGIKK